MASVKNCLSSFGIKVYANKGRKSISQIASEMGMDRKTLWALMYDDDLKKTVAKHLNFSLDEEE